ncbi:MAG: hypothetical protein IN808_02965 [Rubrobacter sp.]|nr:hypothetical protein [Rubrobacter sp.]
MRTATRVGLAAAGSVVLLVGVGWLGLRIKPEPFPPHPEKTSGMSTAGLPSGLPEPVHRHFRATLGERVPRIETAVVWGRASFKLGGLWTPMRLKAYYLSGRGFRRDMEITWFGMPILRGADAYVGGRGSLRIGGLIRASSEGKTMDQGENLAMWGEAPFTTPSALVLDPRVRWEPIDAHSARLIVPFEEGEETLRVEFDPQTGLMKSMSGMRYRGREDTKTPWRTGYSGWKTVHGIKLPHRGVARWEDQREPYIVFEIEGAEFNVDVSEQVPGARASQDVSDAGD